MSKLNLLKPKVKMMAVELQKRAQEVGIDIVFTCTMRTKAAQDKLYARGRTTPGKVVTLVRGGDSMHNYGVAFDICPVVNGQPAWNNITLFNNVGKIGVAIGLEWGGAWKKFVDKPHFQFTAGYSLEDFKTNKFDKKKFI